MTDAARDWSRVAAWLSEQAGKAVTIETAKQLSGGAIQENWLLALDQGGARRRVVLRCDAPSAVAVSLSRAVTGCSDVAPAIAESRHRPGNSR